MEEKEMDYPGMRATIRTLNPNEKQKRSSLPAGVDRLKISGRDLQLVPQLSSRPAVLGISYLLLQPIQLFKVMCVFVNLSRGSDIPGVGDNSGTSWFKESGG